MPSPSSDLIEQFIAYSDGMSSPECFRLWAGISLVAGALERRVWAETAFGTAFPNLYVMLVAPPGVGKQVVEKVRDLWEEATEPGSKLRPFKVAPDSVTNASLIDELGKAKRSMVVPEGAPVTYHSLLVTAEELSVFLPSYDQQFIGTLNSLWENKTIYRESRRHGPAKKTDIDFPQLNLLGGVQPGWLGLNFPEEAWASGLARRMLMIYSGDGPLLDLFAEVSPRASAREALLRRVGELSIAWGQLQWEQSAAQQLGDWHLAGGPPAPTHSKLAHYVRSRTYMIVKLSVISAMSRAPGEKVIRAQDVERAMFWLLTAERHMPDIFRAMIGKSDIMVLEDLHWYVSKKYVLQKREPVGEGHLYDFLQGKVPSERIAKIIEVAERSGWLQRVMGQTPAAYRPLAKPDGAGVE